VDETLALGHDLSELIARCRRAIQDAETKRDDAIGVREQCARARAESVEERVIQKDRAALLTDPASGRR
jgi:hypothetical protein